MKGDRDQPLPLLPVCPRAMEGPSEGPSEGPYDVVVVGAGVEGSSTAYHLARSGSKVLLLEQVNTPE